MRFPTTLGALASHLSIILASPVDLDHLDLPNKGNNSDLLDERSVSPCAPCVSPCNPWIGQCAGPCGAISNRFAGPACGICLNAVKAPAQCQDCVKKCEVGNNPANLMFSSCIGPEFKKNACVGINSPSVHEYGRPGICTPTQFALDGSSGEGVYCPSGFDCDIAVAATTNCQQSGQVGPPPAVTVTVPAKAPAPPPARAGDFGTLLDDLLGQQFSTASSFYGRKRNAATSSDSSDEYTGDWQSGTTSEDDEFQITTSPSSDYQIRDLKSRGLHSGGARVTFLNRTNGVGYNLVIPGDICITTKIGDFADPGTGIVHKNANIGDFFRSYIFAHLRHNDWKSHVKQTAQVVLMQFQALIADDVGKCTPLTPAQEGELKLKVRGDSSLTHAQEEEMRLKVRGGFSTSTDLIESTSSSDLVERAGKFAWESGFWTAAFLATVPGFGIALTALDLAITAQGNKNITTLQEATILASVGVINTLIPVILFRLDIETVFGPFEAAVTSFILNQCHNLVLFIKACFTSETLGIAVNNMRRAASAASLLQVFESSSHATSQPPAGEVELAQSC